MIEKPRTRFKRFSFEKKDNNADTLQEIVKKASELIKDKGKFYLCMTIDRSAELLGELYTHNFHVKKIKL